MRPKDQLFIQHWVSAFVSSGLEVDIGTRRKPYFSKIIETRYLDFVLFSALLPFVLSLKTVLYNYMYKHSLR